MGQGTTGECGFDAVMIRDLTTRRYEYVYGKGRKLAKVEYEGDVMEAQVYYYHNDLLGSPVAMTDMDGKTVWKGDYMPFGEDISPQTSWGNDYTYLGNEDDGGLMYFNARYYQKEVGRFTSPDPIKSVSSTLTMNPYVYCANNPISYTDPTGLSMMPQQRPRSNPDDFGGGGGGGGGDSSDSETFDDAWRGDSGIGGITDVSGAEMTNSFISVLIIVISYGDLATFAQEMLASEGFFVTREGMGFESEHVEALDQEEYNEILDKYRNKNFDYVINSGHNPLDESRTKASGKIFANFTKTFSDCLARGKRLPVKEGGGVALNICYSSENAFGGDNLSRFRNWITRSSGVTASDICSHDGLFRPISTRIRVGFYLPSISKYNGVKTYGNTVAYCDVISIPNLSSWYDDPWYSSYRKFYDFMHGY